MDVAWEFPAIARRTTTAESRGMSGNCSAARAKGANEPAICVSGPRCYMKRMKPPLRSGFVGRPPATSEKRSPINLIGHAEVPERQLLRHGGVRRFPLTVSRRATGNGGAEAERKQQRARSVTSHGTHGDSREMTEEDGHGRYTDATQRFRTSIEPLTTSSVATAPLPEPTLPSKLAPTRSLSVVPSMPFVSTLP